jgi:hypothetical protein
MKYLHKLDPRTVNEAIKDQNYDLDSARTTRDESEILNDTLRCLNLAPTSSPWRR